MLVLPHARPAQVHILRDAELRQILVGRGRSGGLRVLCVLLLLLVILAVLLVVLLVVLALLLVILVLAALLLVILALLAFLRSRGLRGRLILAAEPLLEEGLRDLGEADGEQDLLQQLDALAVEVLAVRVERLLHHAEEVDDHLPHFGLAVRWQLVKLHLLQAGPQCLERLGQDFHLRIWGLEGRGESRKAHEAVGDAAEAQ
mmetsp:Transcript_164370/g.399549  ORF Transcript_164370/g.399549 Transcript_164370/m.399549 type:complete len:202 (-) Transcript_164370:227-832(-)